MENLIFDNGVKEYQLGSCGVLRFNPTDPGLYERFMDAVDEVEKMLEAVTGRAEESGDTSGAAFLAVAAEVDYKTKEVLNKVFGAPNDFHELLGSVSLMATTDTGHTVGENLFEALAPILEAGTKDYVDKQIKNAKNKLNDRHKDIADKYL